MADDPFDFKPSSEQEEAELRRARDDRDARHQQRRGEEAAERRSMRGAGALVLVVALGLIAASVFLQPRVGSLTVTALRVGGLMLGLQGVRLVITGRRVQ